MTALVPVFTPQPIAGIPPAAEAAAQRFAAHCRAESTFRNWRAYARVVERIVRDDFGEKCTLPMRSGLAIGVITQLASDERYMYLPSSIANVSTTISAAHRFSKLPDPTKTDEYIQVLDGINRVLCRDFHPNAKQPILREDLRMMTRAALQPGTLSGFQDAVALNTLWSSGARRREITSTDIRNVIVRDNGYIIFFPRSKTDQYGRGQEVFIPAQPDDAELNPMRYLPVWLRLLDRTTGPLFHDVSKLGNFGKPFSDRRLARLVQRYAPAAGLDPSSVGAHSTRAGYVTQNLLDGERESVVAAHTRHDSLDGFYRYYRPNIRRSVGRRSLTDGALNA